ncbi:MAG: DUF3786 domain-containing protein [Desulfarculus sp.]|nr:MAG: DUF3786 domain-containing protein [Desulfarculus sp.]
MSVDPGENQLFRWADQLPPALWEDLAARPPSEAAQATGALWQDGRFELCLLGRALAVDPAQRRVWRLDQPERPVSFQSGLVLVSTLSRSRGVPPAGRLVTPQELPGGAQFFQGPHAINKKPLAKRFGRDPQGLLDRALALGGEKVEGADVAVRVPGLPMIPLYALLWAGDEEFGPRAVVGLDAYAHHHLALDGLWALTNLMVHRLVQENRD